MGKIYAFMSMSLDGFVAGPNVSVANGMGDGGERLHDWMFSGTDAENEARQLKQFASTGAVLMGRTMLDVGIGHWRRPGLPCAGCRGEVVPILLGDGTRLFTGPDDRAIALTAAAGKVDKDGVAHLTWRVSG